LSRHVCEWANPNLDYDSRITKGWPMVQLHLALAVVAAYLVLVAVGLYRMPPNWKPSSEPKVKTHWLENFKKEPIRIFQAVYNLVQVLLCLFMIVGTVVVVRQRGFTLVCNVFDSKDTELAFMLWVFYMSKILDFVDTFLIVYRSAWAQFTFLHVYHHASIFLMYWLNVNIAYAGDIYYTVIVNSFIHLVMYYYYLKSSFGASPSWGKYLTQLQMVQFVTMNAQAVYLLYTGCDFPRKVTLTYLFYILSLLVLFLQFYIRKHCSRAPKSKEAKNKEGKSD